MRFPSDVSPRNTWRRRIVKTVKREQQARRGACLMDGFVEQNVRLYLRDGGEAVHDIDNRLKDIMDALQGRLGWPKGRKPRWRRLNNDHQARRVVIEKGAPPKQSLGLGHLRIRRLREVRGW